MRQRRSFAHLMSQPKSFAYLAGCQPDRDLERIRQYVTDCGDVPALAGSYCDPPSVTRFSSRTASRRLLREIDRGDHLIVFSMKELGVRHQELMRSILFLWKQGLTIHVIEQNLVVAPNEAHEKALEVITHIYETWQVWHADLTRRAMRIRKLRGEHLGRNAPFGRQAIRKDGKVVRRMDCWWEKKWLRFIEDGLGEGKTIRAIHAEMKRRKARTNDGRQWSYDRVKRYVKQLKTQSQLCGQPAERE